MWAIVTWYASCRELILHWGAVGYMAEVASKKDFAPGKQVEEMQYIGCNRNLMIIQFVAILYGEG